MLYARTWCVVLLKFAQQLHASIQVDDSDLLPVLHTQAGPRTIRHPGDIHRLPSHLGRPLQPPDEVTVEEEGVAVPQGGKKGVRWSRELEEVKSIPSHRQEEEEEEKEEARVINPTPPSVGD